MKDSNKTLFSLTMKLADIIIANNSLLPVLSRFGIKLGFGDKSIAEVCEKYDINKQFLLLICNVYTFEDYLPEKETLQSLDTTSLIDYLSKSHSYYRNEKIIAIEKQLYSMGQCCSKDLNKILTRFFDEYKREILKHFEYEEGVVFPYIESLLKGKHNSGFKITQYEENHSNIEDKLSDLKNIIIKYLPEECSSQERIEVLNEIFLFEEDLSKHSLIEDKILIPFVEEIEKSHDR